MSAQSARLKDGYIVSRKGLDVGLNALNTEGFAFVALHRDRAGADWSQPLGSVRLTGDFSPAGFSTDLPVLVDTGIRAIILWVSAHDAPPNLERMAPFPAGVSVTVSAQPEDQGAEPALRYAFVTGEAGQPMAPSEVEWRVGHGVNTGRNVLAGADHLYDATAGRIGFRKPPR